MKTTCKLMVIAIISLLTLGVAAATTWYVHPDSALNTIQAGLDSCVDNDIVLVAPSTYSENLVWPNTQGIHLISESGPEVTEIKGDTTEDAVIYVGSSVDSTTHITGFTIKHGQNGIFVPSGSISICNNVIKNNNWDGIHTCGGTLYLQENIIKNNLCGLYTHGGWFELIDNDISHNTGSGLVFSPDPSDFRYSRQEINGNIFSHNGGYGIDLLHGILKNATITYNGSGGILMGGADIDSCTIAYNYGPGVTNIEPMCVTYLERQYMCITNCDIFDNTDYGVLNEDTVMIDAEYNWWGDATGPYHPTGNPGGMGDTVSDYVDFDPWLTNPWVDDVPIVHHIEYDHVIGATIFRGTLQLPQGSKCKVFDIMGRVVLPERMRAGIYFIEVDGRIMRKVIKIKE